MRSLPMAVLAASIAIGALGCGNARREECRALTTLINASADRIDKAQATPLDPAGLKALAEALEKSASEADALKLTSADLQEHAKNYAKLVRDVAKTANDMAQAGEARDLDKAKAANTEMEKVVAGEPPLIASVNKACSAE